jgi:predicted transcriptional regulator
MDARLDPATRTKVDELAARFHRPRSVVLSQIMQWGLRRGQQEPIDREDAQSPVRHLYLYVESHLHERVQKAATAAGVKTPPWLRHMVRQITITDFPASWHEERPAERSHDSRIYGTRFMLRLDEASREQLQHLVDHFDVSKAKIIRQLIAQATPEDFSKSWQMRAAERHGPRIP